jgi:hypothetical protein
LLRRRTRMNWSITKLLLVMMMRHKSKMITTSSNHINRRSRVHSL